MRNAAAGSEEADREHAGDERRREGQRGRIASRDELGNERAHCQYPC